MLKRPGFLVGLAAVYLGFGYQAVWAQNNPAPKIHSQFGLSKGMNGKIGPLKPEPTLVIRSARELAAHCDPKKADDADFQREMQKKLAETLKVPSIDWQKQMVVAVARQGQAQRGPLPPVFFTGLEMEKESLVVRWRLQGQEDGWIPYPLGVALVDRFDGPVIFNPPNKSSQPVSPGAPKAASDPRP